MIRVAVSGAGGKLAVPIVNAVVAAEDLVLSALYNPNRAGHEMAGVTVVADARRVGGDVVIETARPDVVFDNLAVWSELGMAAVVGTSGFTAERLDRLGDVWDDDLPCLIVPNFAIGAVLMMKYAEEAAGHFEASEVIERHHSAKSDAPSGTALATAMRIADGGGGSAGGPEELLEGARGAEVEGVRVHALRLPGLISMQEVAMSNPGEMLSISHVSTSYESFAPGAALAARRVRDLPGGVHFGLDKILQ